MPDSLKASGGKVSGFLTFLGSNPRQVKENVITKIVLRPFEYLFLNIHTVLLVTPHLILL